MRPYIHFSEVCAISAYFLGKSGLGLVLELGILSQEIQPEEIPNIFNCVTNNLQMWKGPYCWRYENEPDFIQKFGAAI